jgi:nitroreductase/NAD-dependent dihydropyrimidine dehydrogenase PreA subunit
VIRIDEKLCKACGLCGDICPRHITETINKNGKKRTEVNKDRENLCLTCGQCVAICPAEAISVDNLVAEDLLLVRDIDVTTDQLLNIMQTRRSVRRYKNMQVSRDDLMDLVKAAHCAPTGTGRNTTGLIIIDDPDVLRQLSDYLFETYEKLNKNLKKPISRFFITKKVGEKKVRTLRDFLMPGMEWYIKWNKEGKGSEILRDCPTLMLFHSPIFEPEGEFNCMIAAFQSVIMAQIKGIGTCLNSMIPPICNRMPEIRNLIDLPGDREIYASITMGYPKYEYKRIPDRRLADVKYI